MNPHPKVPTIALLGASGKVGTLLDVVFRRVFSEHVRLWQQTRRHVFDTIPGWFCWESVDAPDGLQRLVDQTGGVDCLINLAGVTPASPVGQLRDNETIARICVAEAARLSIPQVLLASSAAIYGRQTGAIRLAENLVPAPISDYGRAKWAMERVAADFHGGPRVTCLRLGNVAGADTLLKAAESTNFKMPLMLDRFSGGRSPLRSYIGPETLARVMLSLVRASMAGCALPPVLNIASPEPVFMSDLLVALARSGRSVHWRWQDAPSDAIPVVSLDTQAVGRFHTFDPRDSQPLEMIRQWIACIKQE